MQETGFSFVLERGVSTYVRWIVHRKCEKETQRAEVTLVSEAFFSISQCYSDRLYINLIDCIELANTSHVMNLV